MSRVEFYDNWNCKHSLSIEEAARQLKAFYDEYPGGLEEVESAIRTARISSNGELGAEAIRLIKRVAHYPENMTHNTMLRSDVMEFIRKVS